MIAAQAIVAGAVLVSHDDDLLGQLRMYAQHDVLQEVRKRSTKDFALT